MADVISQKAQSQVESKSSRFVPLMTPGVPLGVPTGIGVHCGERHWQYTMVVAVVGVQPAAGYTAVNAVLCPLRAATGVPRHGGVAQTLASNETCDPPANVPVGVTVRVGVMVAVGVMVGVSVMVRVGVLVAVGVMVFVGVIVTVGVSVGVVVLVSVGVAVWMVCVGVGVDVLTMHRPFTTEQKEL